MLAIIICVVAILQKSSAQLRNPVIIESHGGDSCSASVLESVRQDILRNVSIFLSTHCGTATGWRQIAYLNMTDPNEQCPTNWREYFISSQRLCGRLFIQSDWRCDGTFYSPMGQPYSQVCGRIIGYRFDDPDGYTGSRHEMPISTAYVDGVSLTYANPRHHIWSFYGGVHAAQCNNRTNPAPFVGSNYFCDYGDKLWDGEDCSNAPCGVNNPPWFFATLPAPTTESIEVRICGDNGAHDEDTPIQIMELLC